jgi:hypothetical protein
MYFVTVQDLDKVTARRFVTRRGEQYRGWSQLPPPERTAMTPEEAMDVMQRFGGSMPSRQTLADVYRAAVLKTHPDRGGDPKSFGLVQTAKDVLERALS